MTSIYGFFNNYKTSKSIWPREYLCTAIEEEHLPDDVIALKIEQEIDQFGADFRPPHKLPPQWVTFREIAADSGLAIVRSTIGVCTTPGARMFSKMPEPAHSGFTAVSRAQRVNARLLAG